MRIKLLAIVAVITILHTIFLTPNIQAQIGNYKLTAALSAYKSGDYRTALKKISPLKKDKKTKILAYYWEGQIYSKLQEFDKAIKSYEKALSLGSKSQTIYYEYAQALYAADKLPKSRRAFGKSIKKKYKIGTSLYYIAYTSQLMSEDTLAIKYYKKIAKLPKHLQSETAQSAMYQLGELYYAQAKKHPKPRKMIKRFVIPQYELAVRTNETSPMVSDIKTRIYEIKKEYLFIVTKMINGRPVPRKFFTLNLALKSQYDSNVVLESDEATTKAENKSSLIHTGTLFTRYKKTLLNVAMISPELRIYKTMHGDRDNSVIFKNDLYAINPAIRSSWEHTIFDKRGSFLFDLEYSYNEKDFDGEKDIKFYNRALTFVMGEKLRIWDIGPSTLKLKKRHTYNYDPELDSVTTTISATQLMKTSSGHMIVMMANMNFLRNKNVSNDTDNLVLLANYIIPTWKNFVSPTFGIMHIMTDTKLQSESRGTEHMLVPSFSISKKMGKKLKMTWKSDYTKQTSKNKQANAYTKWTTGLEMAYNF